MNYKEAVIAAVKYGETVPVLVNRKRVKISVAERPKASLVQVSDVRPRLWFGFLPQNLLYTKKKKRDLVVLMCVWFFFFNSLCIEQSKTDMKMCFLNASFSWLSLIFVNSMGLTNSER